jgi:hypothetical protein
MSIRDSKERAIKEIMDLRTLIDDIHSIAYEDVGTCAYLLKDNSTKKDEAQRQLNKIHDIVFGM